MKLSKAVPILFSGNIKRSLDYYTQVLGFKNQWDWGAPPTFGGIYQEGIEIYFCENGQGHPGTWLSIFVDDVDVYHDEITARGANVISAPETKPWGIREMLVEDPDGHRIRFGHQVSIREKSEEKLPATVRIVARIPEVKELKRLIKAVGWPDAIPPDLQVLPSAAIGYAVVAEDQVTDRIIGCAFLISDHTDFYYVKNVIVVPEWQGKRVGEALMQALYDWLEKHAPNNAFVCLHTGHQLAPFYQQYGFQPGFGMIRRITR